VAEALVGVLAALHSVDWQASGLADFGRPEGFTARNLRRMRSMLPFDDASTAPFAAMSAWLEEHLPADDGAAAVIHGDFRLGNVMLARDSPARIVAVLDWELATIGHPLMDVGYFLASYAVAGEPLQPMAELGLATLEEGYPSRDELEAQYAEATGRDLTDLRWYTAMTLWKLAIIYAANRRRYEAGTGDAYYADPTQVDRFLTAAHTAAGLAAVT